MHRLPEATLSYWVDSTETLHLSRPSALADVDVNAAVLGAGIAGLTTAYLLTQKGCSVAVIEADRVAAGVSGHRIRLVGHDQRHHERNAAG